MILPESPLPCGPSLVPGRVGLAQHNVRTGWHAWCWRKWANSGRHELRSLDLSPESFRSMSWSSIRTWALSSGAANSVALGSLLLASVFVNRSFLSVLGLAVPALVPGTISCGAAPTAPVLCLVPLLPGLHVWDGLRMLMTRLRCLWLGHMAQSMPA